MTGSVWNPPQKFRQKNQRNATGPDVDTRPVPGDRKAWARYLEDQRNAGNASFAGDMSTKSFKTGSQKRQPGQQYNGKGAESDRVPAATEEVPVDQKLDMSLEAIVNTRKSGPTAEEMGTYLGKKQHAKAAASLALESQHQPQDHPQQQKIQQPKNPQQALHNNQQQPQHQLQQQQQQQQHHHQQQQQQLNNKRNRNNPNNPQYQYAQSLTAYTAGSAGAGKAQKQAQHLNTHNYPRTSNGHTTEAEVIQLDFEEEAILHLKPRRTPIVYVPPQVTGQPQSHKQQQRHLRQQQQQIRQQQQQQTAYFAHQELEQQLYEWQGGDVMQDDADAHAVYEEQAGIWMDGQEQFGVEGLDSMAALEQQQQHYQQQQLHAGHVSGKRQRKLAARGQPQHGLHVMYLSDQNDYLDTMDEEQQGYNQYDGQNLDDDQFQEDTENDLLQPQQQPQQQQQRQQQQPQQQQHQHGAHLSSHGHSVMSGRNSHNVSQNHEVANYMPGLHGPPASLEGLAWADTHQQNHSTRGHHSAGQFSRMDNDGMIDASLGRSRGPQGAGGSGRAVYDSYSQGQVASRLDNSSQQNHALDARHLITGMKVVGWERESSQQPSQHISMPGILLGSEQQPMVSRRGQTADDPPETSGQQRHAASLGLRGKDTEHGQAFDRAEQYQQYEYAEPTRGQAHDRMHSNGVQDDRYTQTGLADQRQATTHTGEQGSAWPGQQQHRSELQLSAAALELSAPVSRHRPAEDYQAPVRSEQIREYQRIDHLSTRQQERQHQWQQRQPLPADLEPAGPALQHHQRHAVASRELSSEPDDTWDPRSRAEDSQLYKVTQSAEPESAYAQPALHPRMPQQLSRASAFSDARNGDDVMDPYEGPRDAYLPQRPHSFEPEEGECDDGRSPSPASDWGQQMQQGLAQPTELPHHPSGARQHLHTQDISTRAIQQPSRKQDAEQQEYGRDGKRAAAYPHAARGPHMNEGIRDSTQSSEDKAGIERSREGASRLPPEESYQQAGRSARQSHQQQSSALLTQGRAAATTKPNSGPESSMNTAAFSGREGRPNSDAVTWTAAAGNGRTHTGTATTSNHQPTAGAAASRQVLSRAPLSLTDPGTPTPTPFNASAARPAGAAVTGAQRSAASPAPEVISIEEDEATLAPSLATLVSGSKKQSVVTITTAAPPRPTPITYVQRSAMAQPSTLRGSHRAMQHSNGAAVTLQQTAQPTAGTIQPVNTAAHIPPASAAGPKKDVLHAAGQAAATASSRTAVASLPAARATGYSPPNHNEPTRSSAAAAETAAPLKDNSTAQPVPTRVSTRTPIPTPQFSSRAAALQAAAASGTTASLPGATAVTATAAAVPTTTSKAATSAPLASTVQPARVATVLADLSGSTTGALQAPVGAAQAGGAAPAMPCVIKEEAATAPAGVSSHASWRQQRKQQRMLQQQDKPAAAPCADEDASAATRKVPFIKQEPTRC